ncbi:MAG: hypothetical protein EOP21_00295 [Hyphomicrobiales bacterium]|nr:MAG: hypothetical protein EOP21_00295 [Hyphomicrobiales bacterium]
MDRRMYCAVGAGRSPITEILLVQEADGSVALYCPPGVAGGPWVERFPKLEQARDLASDLAREIGNSIRDSAEPEGPLSTDGGLAPSRCATALKQHPKINQAHRTGARSFSAPRLMMSGISHPLAPVSVRAAI